jgi:hypothetical protein
MKVHVQDAKARGVGRNVKTRGPTNRNVFPDCRQLNLLVKSRKGQVTGGPGNVAARKCYALVEDGIAELEALCCKCSRFQRWKEVRLQEAYTDLIS